MDHTIRRSCLSYVTTALLVTTVTLVMGCGDGASPVAPGSPSASAPVPATTSQSTTSAAGAAVTKAAKIEVCHRTEGSKDFVAISVAPAALDAHLAHGDALVGAPVPDQPDQIFGPDCMARALAPVTITFTGLLVNGAPVSTYAESGVDVVVTSSNWEAWTSYGNPAPMIIFRAAAGAPPTPGAIAASSGGDVFKFSSVDLYSSTTPIPYVFEGYLNSTLVFTASGTVPNTFGMLATVPNPYAGMLIDRLVITLTNAPAPCCANPMGLDNLTVVK